MPNPSNGGAFNPYSDVRLTQPTASLGFGPGSGGAVTQITSSSTGVTLHRNAGRITTVALTTAAAAEERFTVTCNQCAATDAIAFGTTYNGNGTPSVSSLNQTNGSFDVLITNTGAAALNALMVINFAIIKVSIT